MKDIPAISDIFCIISESSAPTASSGKIRVIYLMAIYDNSEYQNVSDKYVDQIIVTVSVPCHMH